MSPEHQMVSQNEEVFRKQMMMALSRARGTNIKELPVAKLEQFEQ